MPPTSRRPRRPESVSTGGRRRRAIAPRVVSPRPFGGRAASGRFALQAAEVLVPRGARALGVRLSRQGVERARLLEPVQALLLEAALSAAGVAGGGGAGLG